MDPIYSLSAQSNERAQKIAEIIIKAAKETHAVVSRSEAFSQQARSSNISPAMPILSKASLPLPVWFCIGLTAPFMKP